MATSNRLPTILVPTSGNGGRRPPPPPPPIMDAEFTEIRPDADPTGTKKSRRVWKIRSIVSMTAGLIISLLVGRLLFANWGVELVRYIVSTDNAPPVTTWDFIGFWPAFIIGTAAFFFGGVTKKTWNQQEEAVDEKGQIKIGYAAVMTIFGQPIPHFTLGPGTHWMLPLIMGIAVVDTRLITTKPQEMKVLSLDNYLMDVSMFLKLKVVDLSLYLTVEDPVESLKEIAAQELWLIVNGGKAMDLVKPKASRAGSVSQRILDKIRADGLDFGIEVLDVVLPRFLPPTEVTTAAAKKQTEIEERAAEKIEMDGLIARVRELKAQGFTPEQAREFLQIERGKIKPTMNISRIKIDDADTIAKAIVEAIEIVFRKKG